MLCVLLSIRMRLWRYNDRLVVAEAHQRLLCFDFNLLVLHAGAGAVKKGQTGVSEKRGTRT